jgi:hypothetical protein
MTALRCHAQHVLGGIFSIRLASWAHRSSSNSNESGEIRWRRARRVRGAGRRQDSSERIRRCLPALEGIPMWSNPGGAANEKAGYTKVEIRGTLEVEGA